MFASPNVREWEGKSHVKFVSQPRTPTKFFLSSVVSRIGKVNQKIWMVGATGLEPVTSSV